MFFVSLIGQESEPLTWWLQCGRSADTLELAVRLRSDLDQRESSDAVSDRMFNSSYTL